MGSCLLRGLIDEGGSYFTVYMKRDLLGICVISFISDILFE